jgi:RNA polymerase primary sigma factor
MSSWWHEQAGRYPLLTAAQEIHLGTAVRGWLDHPDPVPPATIRRGQRARDQFVRANLRMVISVVDRYRDAAPQYRCDLIQAGNEGLIRAVEKFDPTRGYKFSTYGYWWIRQSIHAYLEHHSRNIRLPTSHALQHNRLQAAMLRLLGELERPPSRQELADAAGWSVTTLEAILARPQATLSLDAPNRRMDDGTPLMDCIAAQTDDPLDALHNGLQLEKIEGFLHHLSPLGRRVIEDQFLSPTPSSLGALAKRERISRQQIRNTLNHSLRHLRRLASGCPLEPLKPPEHQPAEIGEQIELTLGP